MIRLPSSILVLSAALVVNIPRPLNAAEDGTRPNLLLILADDVGQEVLGCYGGESYPTPRLDRLAASGLRFTHGYSMAVCHPTRVALLSGAYPFRLGGPKWGSYPPDEESRTIANRLKRAGYATAVAGKWQLTLLKNDPDHAKRMGFERSCLFGWHEGPRYYDPLIWQDGALRTGLETNFGPEVYTDFLIDFMKEERKRPFFAFYSMALCHDVTDDLKEPVPYRPGKDRYDTYAEMVDDMDRMVGKLMDALERLGLRENTVVLFVGDNGTASRSISRAQDGKFLRDAVVSSRDGRRIPGGKGTLRDSGTRVPWVASWPRVTPAGNVVDDLVDVSDVLPTFLDLAGASVPKDVGLDGVSFAPRLRGLPEGASGARTWVFAEHKAQSWVRTRRWKLYGDGRFYDVANDLSEKRSLHPGGAPDDGEAVRRRLVRHHEGLAKRPAARSRVVVVKPVILCDDDGKNAARHALPKTWVDRVYTNADLEFLYLEPMRWNHGKARRGEINLDEIVREGLEARIISRDPRIVTLLFVSKVDGRPGPLGRGKQNGNICFVSLGPEGAMKEPAERAFVVAHEVGHCLNLIHAVDDPAVPDDVPNLQGDGAYEDRLTVASLHPTQRDTVLRSPLVLDRILFHNPEEGGRLLGDESWEPYISDATDDMLRFSIGLKAGASIPENAEERRAFIRARYAEKVLEFTSGEKKLLRQRVDRLRELTGEAWPSVARLPWHFIKVNASFCRGMAHTRGLAIVFSERYLQRMANDERFALKILLHEKMHVVQRLNGSPFASLYTSYGFHPVKLAAGEPQRLHLAQNPDAFELDQAIRLGDTPAMLVTRLVPDEDGDFEFQAELRRLHELADGTSTLGLVLEETDEFRTWRDSFPLSVGHDHPNEISAYLIGILLDRDFLQADDEPLGEEHATWVEQTRRAFQRVLRLEGE